MKKMIYYRYLMDVVFFFKLEMPLLLYCLTHALYKWEMLIFR